MTAPIELILGDESLRVREAEQAALAAVFDGGAPGFNLAVYQAGSGADGALDTARTAPMMGKRRAVVIQEMEKAPVKLLDALLAYSENPVDSTVLVLVGSKLPPATEGRNRGASLQNAIRKVGRVQRFKAADEDPAAFAVECATAQGCTLSRRDAALLVQFVGADLGRVRAEVDKAVSFVGGSGAIDGEVIAEVCSLVGEAVVWDLTDALVRRDADKALAVAHRMLEDGEASHRLLAMITWQFRQLLVLQDTMRHGRPVSEAKLRMPGHKLRAAEQSLRQRELSTARVLETLARANRDLNRSRAGDRRVFEGLLIELAAG